MTLEQFNALVALLPSLEDAVKEKGGVIIRPEYGAANNDNDEVEMEEEEEQAAKRSNVSPEKNIEATSDESEED